MREKQFQLHGREEPAWASVAAGAKIHIGAVGAGEVVLVALRRILAQIIVSQAVKCDRVRCYFRIEQYVPGRYAEVCAGRYFNTGREGQRLKRDTVKGDWKINRLATKTVNSD